MEKRRCGLRWFSPPLCLQNVSNYLHLPPTNLRKPNRAFLPLYPPQCPNYSNSTLSHLSCKALRLDDNHPLFLFLSRVSSPRLSDRKWELKKKTGKERSKDERLRCRKEWWNLRCFSCNNVPHLCVQKVIYSEWSSRRWDLGGTQFHQVGEMAWGEAMGLLMYSALTFMESNLKKHAFIQTQRQMESHTQPQECANTHTIWWHICTHRHLDECINLHVHQRDVKILSSKSTHESTS